MTQTDHLRLRLIGLESSVELAQRMLAEGKTLEDVLSRLRADGLDMIDSKYVTMEVAGLSAAAAQGALYRSETWQDLRPAIDRLEDAIIEAALEMGAEVRIDGQLVPANRRQ